MESLDSPLLLRIFRTVMCPAGGTEGSIVVAEPIASDDDAGALAPPADEEALHPKHLHTVAVAVSLTCAMGTWLVPVPTQLRRVTNSDEVKYIVLAATVETCATFFTFQVLASTGAGLEAVVVVGALAGCAKLLTDWVVFNGARPSNASLLSCVCVLLSAAAYGNGGDPSARGPSFFPATEFDGRTAAIMCFFAMFGRLLFSRYESKRAEKALEAGEAAWDPWSRTVYVNACSFFLISGLAVMFRVHKTYEKALLGGTAGIFLLLSCGAAITAAIMACAVAPDNGITPRKLVIVAFARAISIFMSWEFHKHSSSAFSTFGLFACVVAATFARPPRAAQVDYAHSTVDDLESLIDAELKAHKAKVDEQATPRS
jgi:hypothetical protein